MRPPKYIPSFHGLRAVACLAVFGVHLEQATKLDGQIGAFDLGLLLQNGNTGVCLFFMMSGFLLSMPFWFRGANSESSSGEQPQRFQPLRYAVKRIGRIVPPYYLCLTALVLLGKADGTLDIALHYLFIHNFTDKTLYSINDPFWTLAVQAQFYVLFPFILLFLRPFVRRKTVAFVLVAVACVGCFIAHNALLSWANTGNNWSFAGNPMVADGPAMHVSTLAHLPHFLLGMLAAAVFAGLSPRNANDGVEDACEFADGSMRYDVLFWVCAIAMLCVLAIPDLDINWRIPAAELSRSGGISDTEMVGRYNFPYVPLLVAGLLISGPRSRVAKRLLETAPLRMLGVISFGIYVYHLPCLGVAKKLVGFKSGSAQVSEGWLMLAIVGLMLSIVVAAASFLLIERPLIRLTRRDRSS